MKTKEELIAERNSLAAKNLQTAARIDALVGARHERIQEIERELRSCNFTPGNAGAVEADSAAKILDHKWLDPECIEKGCQSLVWKGRYESAVKGREEFRQAYREARAPTPAALDPVTVEACAKIADKVAVDWQEDAEAYAAKGNFHRANVSISHRSGAKEAAMEIRKLSHPAPGNAGEAFGWFEPITPTFGGSLVERFAKGPDKPRHFSDFAFRLYAAPASNPQEGGAVSRRASEGDPK